MKNLNRYLLAVAGYAILAITLIMASWDTAVALSNVNASRRLGNESEATVAINRINPKNIVVVSNIAEGNGLFKGVRFVVVCGVWLCILDNLYAAVPGPDPTFLTIFVCNGPRL